MKNTRKKSIFPSPMIAIALAGVFAFGLSPVTSATDITELQGSIKLLVNPDSVESRYASLSENGNRSDFNEPLFIVDWSAFESIELPMKEFNERHPKRARHIGI